MSDSDSDSDACCRAGQVLVYRPEARLTAVDCLAHPFFEAPPPPPHTHTHPTSPITPSPRLPPSAPLSSPPPPNPPVSNDPFFEPPPPPPQMHRVPSARTSAHRTRVSFVCIVLRGGLPRAPLLRGPRGCWGGGARDPARPRPARLPGRICSLVLRQERHPLRREPKGGAPLIPPRPQSVRLGASEGGPGDVAAAPHLADYTREEVRARRAGRPGRPDD